MSVQATQVDAFPERLIAGAQAIFANNQTHTDQSLNTNTRTSAFSQLAAESTKTNRLTPEKSLLTGNIAVIYPALSEPFRAAFGEILQGIESKAKGRIVNIPLSEQTSAEDLQQQIRNNDAKVVIALGRQGMKAAAGLNNVNVVVGGVFSSANVEMRNAKVNSLAPDPALLFARLKQLMPQAKRVFAVYDPRQNDWLIRLAQAAAREQGLELVAYETTELRVAMRMYQKIFSEIDTKNDAVWLLQDSMSVDENTILPMVLQESWAKNLAIFSSNLNHVKRGVLFAYYPDHRGLGQYLASAALTYLTDNATQSVGTTPLREVLVAVNIRTAKHLGLSNVEAKQFNLVFPEP